MVSFETQRMQETIAVQVDLLLVWSSGAGNPRFWASRIRYHTCPVKKARTLLCLPPALRAPRYPGTLAQVSWVSLDQRWAQVVTAECATGSCPQVGKGRTEVKALRESASCEEAGPRGAAPGWGPESPRAQLWRNLLSCSLPGLVSLDPADFRLRSMACGAAERGPEPPAFQRHPEASAPCLAQGYRFRSMSELRDQEFGRLAGEGLTRGLAGLEPRCGALCLAWDALCT